MDEHAMPYGAGKIRDTCETEIVQGPERRCCHDMDSDWPEEWCGKMGRKARAHGMSRPIREAFTRPVAAERKVGKRACIVLW